MGDWCARTQDIEFQFLPGGHPDAAYDSANAVAMAARVVGASIGNFPDSA